MVRQANWKNLILPSTQTWVRVFVITKLYRARMRAGLALKRARTAGSELRIAECAASFQAASKLVNKVKGTEVRKTFQRSMEEEVAKGLPELSKKAHQAFKGLTGATSKHNGLGDDIVVTWHTRTPSDQAGKGSH